MAADDGAGRVGVSAEERWLEVAKLLASNEALHANPLANNPELVAEMFKPLQLDDDDRADYAFMYGNGFGEDQTFSEHAAKLFARSKSLAERPVHLRDLAGEDVILAKNAAGARMLGVLPGFSLRDESGGYYFTGVFDPPAELILACSRCGHDTHLLPQLREWVLEPTGEDWHHVLYFDLKTKCPSCDGIRPSKHVSARGYAGPWLIGQAVARCFNYDKAQGLTNHALYDQGFDLQPGTMALWCRDVAEAGKPVYDLLYRQTRESTRLCVMQHPVKLLPVEPQRDARVWMMGDAKVGSPQVFDFTFGKSKRPPVAMMEGFKGKVVTLGMHGEHGVELEKGVPRLTVLNHALALLDDARSIQPELATACDRLVTKLDQIDGHREGEELLAARRGAGMVHLAAIRELLVRLKESLVTTHPLAVRAEEVLRQWAHVEAFMMDEELVDPRAMYVRDFMMMPAMYPGTIFVGTRRGCETASVLATLVTTCRVIGFEPCGYFAQMLLHPEEVAAHPEEWLPHVFAARVGGVENRR